MRTETVKKANQVLLFMFFIVVALYYGSSVLIPFTFSVFFAALILPFVNWFERISGSNKLISAFVGTFIIFVGVGVLMFFLIQQLGFFLTDIIESREAILAFAQNFQKEAAEATGFSLNEQEKLLEDNLTGILNFTQGYISGFLTGAGLLLFNFLLILVLMFLVLLNREKFLVFLRMYRKKEMQGETDEVLEKIQKVVYKYLWGRVQVMSILSIMYIILFTAYDLRHWGLLVIFGALITIIPYVGPFISGLLPIIFLIVFGGSSAEIISFTILIVIIQLIESYVLEPILIGSEVEQSPLFIIIAILIGGMLWGPSGLILFVPLFSILKILFDHSRGLEPVGYLMGYERPGSKGSFWQRMKSKLKKDK